MYFTDTGHGEAETDAERSEKLTLAKLRSALDWSRIQLAHVMNASDWAIVYGAFWGIFEHDRPKRIH